jgi:hypothetical protein
MLGTSGTPQMSKDRGVAEVVDFWFVLLVNAALCTWSFRTSELGLTRVRRTTSHL